VFDQANEGAQEAHAELKNPGKLEYLAPRRQQRCRPDRDRHHATTQGVKAS